MKIITAFIAAVLLAAAVPGAALAHHSGAEFDFTKVYELGGVVKDVRVINPHMSLTLVVHDSRGTHDIQFEGHSVNNFYRAGWRPHMINVGDTIKVKFAPRKNGAEGGFVIGFVTAAGRSIGFMIPKNATVVPAPEAAGG